MADCRRFDVQQYVNIVIGLLLLPWLHILQQVKADDHDSGFPPPRVRLDLADDGSCSYVVTMPPCGQCNCAEGSVEMAEIRQRMDDLEGMMKKILENSNNQWESSQETYEYSVDSSIPDDQSDSSDNLSSRTVTSTKGDTSYVGGSMKPPSRKDFFVNSNVFHHNNSVATHNPTIPQSTKGTLEYNVNPTTDGAADVEHFPAVINNEGTVYQVDDEGDVFQMVKGHGEHEVENDGAVYHVETNTEKGGIFIPLAKTELKEPHLNNATNIAGSEIFATDQPSRYQGSTSTVPHEAEDRFYVINTGSQLSNQQSSFLYTTPRPVATTKTTAHRLDLSRILGIPTMTKPRDLHNATMNYSTQVTSTLNTFNNSDVKSISFTESHGDSIPDGRLLTATTTQSSAYIKHDMNTKKEMASFHSTGAPNVHEVQPTSEEVEEVTASEENDPNGPETTDTLAENTKENTGQLTTPEAPRTQISNDFITTKDGTTESHQTVQQHDKTTDVNRLKVTRSGSSTLKLQPTLETDHTQKVYTDPMNPNILPNLNNRNTVQATDDISANTREHLVGVNVPTRSTHHQEARTVSIVRDIPQSKDVENTTTVPSKERDDANNGFLHHRSNLDIPDLEDQLSKQDIGKESTHQHIVALNHGQVAIPEDNTAKDKKANAGTLGVNLNEVASPQGVKITGNEDKGIGTPRTEDEAPSYGSIVRINTDSNDKVVPTLSVGTSLPSQESKSDVNAENIKSNPTLKSPGLATATRPGTPAVHSMDNEDSTIQQLATVSLQTGSRFTQGYSRADETKGSNLETATDILANVNAEIITRYASDDNNKDDYSTFTKETIVHETDRRISTEEPLQTVIYNEHTTIDIIENSKAQLSSLTTLQPKSNTTRNIATNSSPTPLRSRNVTNGDNVTPRVAITEVLPSDHDNGNTHGDTTMVIHATKDIADTPTVHPQNDTDTTALMLSELPNRGEGQNLAASNSSDKIDVTHPNTMASQLPARDGNGFATDSKTLGVTESYNSKPEGTFLASEDPKAVTLSSTEPPQQSNKSSSTGQNDGMPIPTKSQDNNNEMTATPDERHQPVDPSMSILKEDHTASPYATVTTPVNHIKEMTEHSQKEHQTDTVTFELPNNTEISLPGTSARHQEPSEHPASETSDHQGVTVAIDVPKGSTLPLSGGTATDQQPSDHHAADKKEHKTKTETVTIGVPYGTERQPSDATTRYQQSFDHEGDYDSQQQIGLHLEGTKESSFDEVRDTIYISQAQDKSILQSTTTVMDNTQSSEDLGVLRTRSSHDQVDTIASTLSRSNFDLHSSTTSPSYVTDKEIIVTTFPPDVMAIHSSMTIDNLQTKETTANTQGLGDLDLHTSITSQHFKIEEHVSNTMLPDGTDLPSSITPPHDHTQEIIVNTKSPDNVSPHNSMTFQHDPTKETKYNLQQTVSTYITATVEPTPVHKSSTASPETTYSKTTDRSQLINHGPTHTVSTEQLETVPTASLVSHNIEGALDVILNNDEVISSTSNFKDKVHAPTERMPGVLTAVEDVDTVDVIHQDNQRGAVSRVNPEEQSFLTPNVPTVTIGTLYHTTTDTNVPRQHMSVSPEPSGRQDTDANSGRTVDDVTADDIIDGNTNSEHSVKVKGEIGDTDNGQLLGGDLSKDVEGELVGAEDQMIFAEDEIAVPEDERVIADYDIVIADDEMVVAEVEMEMDENEMRIAAEDKVDAEDEIVDAFDELIASEHESLMKSREDLTNDENSPKFETEPSIGRVEVADKEDSSTIQLATESSDEMKSRELEDKLSNGGGHLTEDEDTPKMEERKEDELEIVEGINSPNVESGPSKGRVELTGPEDTTEVELVGGEEEPQLIGGEEQSAWDEESESQSSEHFDDADFGNYRQTTPRPPTKHTKTPPTLRPLLVGEDPGMNSDGKPPWRELKQKLFPNGAPDKPIRPTPLARAAVNCVDGCSCVRHKGYKEDGVYSIPNPPSSGRRGRSFSVGCEMHKDGSAWTVIQRRVDASTNFFRPWDRYAHGFGVPDGNFWIGNNFLHALTRRFPYQLRVEFTDWKDKFGYAVYDRFEVEGKKRKYRLLLGNFIAGNRGDALSYHNNTAFSTLDRDNDMIDSINCAELRQAGFWFKACNKANPNGRWIGTHEATGLNGGVLTWGTWPRHGFTYALKTFKMMIKPVPDFSAAVRG